ncbi:TonB-dependent receptor [Pedobacter metabolipauper]|uniref:Outer membrane receptor for ferrienterochelin and colicins n=1 Tax=Pedobacter metabolipauper TaxID=425513 RepID=A0A4R6SRX9_9SPHI|nr:TonB-dependent receptor [Pedobacter metabolipauper]TDQ07702.1 outer membrane receptor for ferrienterochelin and colicins [Pedobacter metabolipauper]
MIKNNYFKLFNLLIFMLVTLTASAQNGMVTGKVISEGEAVPSATIAIQGTLFVVKTDSIGRYNLGSIPEGTYKVQASAVGFRNRIITLELKKGESKVLDFDLSNFQNNLNEIVVTGTLKAVNRLESPVPVEVYTPGYFKMNPTPSIFDALQNVNGVRPQLNCNICNTGDIHINGLEGPYTMILIDGMPIVSSLSTVYGLSGIPNSLVEQIEIVKGPASSLYGSEAVGGLINIITKKPEKAALISADVFSTSYKELNADLGFKFNAGKKATVLTGLNYFLYNNPVDHNHDNFTDVTLQDRISIFQKWTFKRKEDRVFSLGARYMYENRWGGEMQWNKSFRGGDQVYGESIYTNRWELIGNYQLPVKEKLFLAFSYNEHNQDSRYGTTSYIAEQKIGFTQLTWDKRIDNHDLLVGAALRYTFYDDNTAATTGLNQVIAKNTWLPGLFVQDEITLSEKHKVLAGFRYDYNSVHGNIFTPRAAYKWSINENNILRLNAGTGFRVVNIFTEDHAALTGARSVEITGELKPEKTYNVNLNYLKKMYTEGGTFIGVESSAFYTYFNNRIIGNFDIDPNKIIYDNLDGYAVSKGLSTNVDVTFSNGLKLILGATYQDVATYEAGIKKEQILTEKFAGNWAISYKIRPLKLTVDYTGNIYSPMRLPLLSDLDPRREYSKTWSIQNIQFTFAGFNRFEVYGGVKNLLNWTPNRGNPFIIARANDPFDKQVQLDPAGQVMVTPDNPYGLTFDPTYVYGPNQGIRGFFGIRYTIK